MLSSNQYGSHDGLVDKHHRHDQHHHHGKHHRHDSLKLDSNFGNKSHVRSKSMPTSEAAAHTQDTKQQRGRFKVSFSTGEDDEASHLSQDLASQDASHVDLTHGSHHHGGHGHHAPHIGHLGHHSSNGHYTHGHHGHHHHRSAEERIAAIPHSSMVRHPHNVLSHPLAEEDEDEVQQVGRFSVVAVTDLPEDASTAVEVTGGEGGDARVQLRDHSPVAVKFS
eukprot:m.111451 g.111451  ORF g.111451 m.111451 type:complete len:222 (-) comp15385_c0_seq1:32-697(-)